VIQVNDERRWLYAAVDPAINLFVHIRLSSTPTAQLAVLFLRELHDEQHVDNATRIVDAAPHLTAALDRSVSGFGSVTIKIAIAPNMSFRTQNNTLLLFQRCLVTLTSDSRVVAPGPRPLAESILKHNTTMSPSEIDRFRLHTSF